ncbi:MAG: hypothetical protein ACKV2V_27920 [Blastocatellia bacterium]
MKKNLEFPLTGCLFSLLGGFLLLTPGARPLAQDKGKDKKAPAPMVVSTPIPEMMYSIMIAPNYHPPEILRMGGSPSLNRQLTPVNGLQGASGNFTIIRRGNISVIEIEARGVSNGNLSVYLLLPGQRAISLGQMNPREGKKTFQTSQDVFSLIITPESKLTTLGPATALLKY